MIRYTFRDRLVPRLAPARRARRPARSPLSDPVDGMGAAGPPPAAATATAPDRSRRDSAG